MGNYDFSLDLETENTMSIINNWIEEESNVLEFGSANGRLTKYLSEEKNCNVTIVELDEASGNEAKEFAVNSYVGNEYGDIEKYYWSDQEAGYQYIIFADVLEHLRNPKKVLEECKKLLKDNGNILVSIPNIAHNSILIDLMNDKFIYSKTGLLDNTHIHFFTYKTFITMIEECGLYVDEVIPVYSRVANNEIDNSYMDIPTEVAQFLRKRPEGAVYQYVFKISTKEDIEVNGCIVEGLEIEKHEELEAQVYYKDSIDNEYCDNDTINTLYFENEVVTIEVKLEELADKRCIRLDPMNSDGIILLQRCEVWIGDKHIKLQVRDSNSTIMTGNLYMFEENDPWIEFEKLEEDEMKGILHIEFTVLTYRMSECSKKQITQVLKEATGKEISSHLIQSYEDTILEQKNYISHLEKDIAELKEFIENNNKKKKWF